jgi:hypothetical protein
MTRKLLLAPLTSLALLLSVSATDAAEWHRIDSVAHRYSGSAQVAAQAYLKTATGNLDLGSVDLQYRNDLAVGSHRTARFTQQYKGLPVLGASAAVRLGPDGTVKVAVLDVARDLDVSTVPAIDALVAQSIAQARAGNKQVTPNFAPHLAVLPDSSGPAKLVWSVDLAGTRYLVDAHRGLVVSERAMQVDVQGRVYPISSVVTPATIDVELTELDVAAPQLLTGWNGNLTVTNYVSGGSSNPTVSQELVANMGVDFLYDPPASATDATDGFAQVGIFYHLTRMKDYFTTSFGLDMTPASWQVVAVANLLDNGAPLENAFFSPQGIGAPWNAPNLIGIGQGPAFDFSDDSDVFLHEFGHYVSHNAVGYNEGQLAATEYGLSPWGGSIDEGIADYFACSENDDSTLGEASLALLGAARDLTDTSKACPDGIFGEVHADGEMIGSFGWTLRSTFGEAAGDQLVWGATSLLTTGSSFGDFGRGIQQTAMDLVSDGVLQAADLATIDALLADRGLDDCDEELELNQAKPTRTTTMFGLDLLGQAFGADCATLKLGGLKLHSLFHFKHTPAATDESITFKVDLDPQGNGQLDWGIYVRADQHVGFSNGMFLPEIAQFDYQLVNLSETSAELTIDASSTPPFDPTKTYYMVIGNQNCPAVNATISLGTPISPTGAGGAGGAGGGGGAGGNGAGGNGAGTGNGSGGAAPDPEPEDDSDCGCRVVGTTPSSAPWAGLSGLILAAAAWSRRRSRKS